MQRTTLLRQVSRSASLESRVHRLAFECEHPEDALMSEAKRLLAYKPIERFDPQGKLPTCKRALRTNRTGTEPLQIRWYQILGSVDDPQVLRSSALDRRLGDAAPSLRNKIQRLLPYGLEDPHCGTFCT